MGFTVARISQDDDADAEPEWETEALVKLTSAVHATELANFQHNMHVRDLIARSRDEADVFAKAWRDKSRAALRRALSGSV
tara:strand:- start:374 stop:616 length:243 start_codon:yes stop_codon:yes gene_type:complete